MRKMQHYVPKMILKRFSLPSIDKKCWTYDLRSKKITLKQIDEVCASNYFYEIKDKNGNYINPDGANKVEEGLGKIEGFYATLFDGLIKRLDNSDGTICLRTEEIGLICAWISLLIFRNPVVHNVIPLVAGNYGISIKDAADKKRAFIEMLPLELKAGVEDLRNGQITFLKAPKSSGFIISDIPVFFQGTPIHNYCYSPLSSEYAILVSKSDSALQNLNRCEINTLSDEECGYYNNLIYQSLLNAYKSKCLNGATIIAHNKGLLQRTLMPGFALDN